MNKFALMALLTAFTASTAFAANQENVPKAYQVTGKLVSVTATKLIIKKGNKKWEIARSDSAPLPAGTAPGSFVTVKYTMTAVDVVTSAAPQGKARLFNNKGRGR